MAGLGTQLDQILTRKISELGPAAEAIAKQIGEKVDVQSREGRGFGEDPYDNTYSQAYADRHKGGSLSPVTLRNRAEEIENKTYEVGRGRAKIRFQDEESGRIFRYHHEGRAGNSKKIRSIFPKTAASLDAETKALALQRVKNVLSPK